VVKGPPLLLLCYLSKAKNILIPQLAEAREYEDARLTCQFDVKRIMWKGPWTKSRTVETHGNTILIKNLTKKEEGWYYCLTNSEEIIPWNFEFFKGPPVFTVPVKALLRSRAYLKVIGLSLYCSL